MLRNLIFPDYCCSCGEIGAVLCESCIYDIVSERIDACVACGVPQGSTGRCTICRLPYSHAWYVGWHRGALKSLVAASKFGANRSGCEMQARLLDGILPQFPKNAIVVPVPTIARHVRQRGYGHAERVARALARYRGVPWEQLVIRKEQHVQHGASKKVRQQQAKRSFAIDDTVRDDAIYIVVDDVYTTGSTVAAVAGELRAAGASDVWVAITSRQPLDGTR